MGLNETRTNFDSRIQEAKDFVDFVVQLEGTETNGTPLKTLKASCFLLLYNLVEFTLTGAIESIHEEIDSNGFGFDECRDELQAELHRMLCTRTWEKIRNNVTSINKDMVYKTFIRKEVFSGNLDPRRFQQQAKRYGFRPPLSKNYDKLRELKDKRNDLAHGVFSFEEIGRNVTVQDLEHYVKIVKSYLTKAMDNIADYLSNRRYLRNPNSVTAPV